jgi:YaiO family outer membrane protein
MTVRSFAASVALFAMVIGIAPIAARAGEWEINDSVSGFTSPGNLYGPWNAITLSDREKIGNDKPGISIVQETNSDSGGPTHGLEVVLDDYHDWSPKFFTYGAVGVSSGNLLPTRSAYLEGDAKLGQLGATVIGFGAGTVVNPNGVVQNYLNMGPTWYHNNLNVTLRWLPAFTSGRMGTSTGLLTVANGAVGVTITTLTLLAGNQPPNGIVIATTLPNQIGQRALLAGVDVKHWLSKKGGYDVGIQMERLTNSASGNMIYIRRALSLGVFREIGSDPNY